MAGEAQKIVFWDQSDPVAFYIKALQKFLGVPSVGRWTLAAHQAFYAFLSTQIQGLDRNTAWGATPDQTGSFVSQLFEQADDVASFTALRLFLAQIGLNFANVEQYAVWTQSLSEGDVQKGEQVMMAVARAVAEAEVLGPPDAAAAVAAAPDATVAQQGEITLPSNEFPSPVAPSSDTGIPVQTPEQAPAPTVAPAAPAPAAPIIPAQNGTAPLIAPVAGKLSRGAKIGIGIGIGVAVLGLGYLIWASSQKKKQAEAQAQAGMTLGEFGDCGCSR